MTKNFTIIEKTINTTLQRHSSSMCYTGKIEAPNGIPTTQDFINALDPNNFGGTADFRKTDKDNVYTFIAYVHID